jgi:hypothetical protein
MKKHPVLAALQKASKGLEFPSETDAPLEPFLWEDGGAAGKPNALQQARSASGEPVEETTLDGFFRTVPKEDRAKFEGLLKVLREQLADVKVYKVGDEAEKTVYVVGKAKDGKLAGVKTTVVET